MMAITTNTLSRASDEQNTAAPETTGFLEENKQIQSSFEERCIAILGTGNYGRALAYRFESAGLNFCFGSGNPKGSFGDKQLLSYEDAVTKCDVIFLAIPGHAYDSVIEPMDNLFENKIVVDVSNLDDKNDPSNAIRLQAIIPEAYVMKAMNTISAYTLENDTYGAARATYICGDNAEKKLQLIQILTDAGFTPIDKGRLSSASVIEQLPFRFFPEWRRAVVITLVLTALTWFYMYFHLFWYQRNWKDDVPRLPLTIANRLLAWISIWLLSLTYLPGILAGFVQICFGTKDRRFPGWLDKWMKCRKQLGLISLFLALIHTCMSCLLLGSGEVSYMLGRIKIPGINTPLYQGLNIIGQVSLLFATLALALMSVLGITSLPSVNMHMSWKEWDFVQGGLGFISLIFGFVHLMVLSYIEWTPLIWKILARSPKGIFPFSVFVMALLPIIVIVMKLILMLPGLSCYLRNIRKGKVGYQHIRSGNYKIV